MAEREGTCGRCREQREAVFGLVESVWRGMEPGEPREGKRGPWGGLRMPLKDLGATEGFWKKKGGIGPVGEFGGEAGKQGVACLALDTGGIIPHPRCPAR